MELHTPKYVKVLQYVVMIIMALFMFFPIYWIFVNSLKTITGISAWLRSSSRRIRNGVTMSRC